MGVEIQTFNIMKVSISGRLSVADQMAIKSQTVEYVAKNGTVRVVVHANNFEGWTNEKAWEEFGLQVSDELILKMAIVADERFKDNALMFVGKGFRSFPIEFFGENQLRQAIHWVLE